MLTATSCRLIATAGCLALVIIAGMLPVTGITAMAQQAIVNDHRSFYPPAVSKPPRFGSYVDPVFNTRVTRITDDAATFGTGGVSPEYAQISAFNRDDSYLILRPSNGSTALHDGAGNFLRMVNSPNGTLYEPRWSRINRDWFYYHTGSGRRIYRYSVSANSHTLVANYAVAGAGKSRVCNNSIFFGGGQSDISDNERINITCDDRYLMVVDLQTGRDFGVGDAQGNFDAVTLAMDGESMAVAYNQEGSARFTGFEQWSKEGDFMVQLMHSGGHLAMARQTDGTPVMVVNNANSFPQQPACPNCDWNGIVKVSLDGNATRTLLIGLIGVSDNCCAAELFAGRSGDGWVYVGTYRGFQPSQGEWLGYDQEIFRIRLDPADGHSQARVERLVHTRSTSVNYLATPLLSVSQSGRKLVFPSDFGNSNGTIDTYMFDVDGGAPDPGFYVLDGMGGLHSGGDASPLSMSTPYFGFDAAADLEFGATGYYVLDRFGGLHRGGGAPVMNPATPYFGFDAAADLELASTGYYVLDRFGGVHRGGGAPLMNPGTPYFGFNAAVDLEVASTGYYVLDRFGGVHPGGGAAVLSPAPPYFGFDLARELELASAGGVYVLDGFGGIHRAGGAPPVGGGTSLSEDAAVDVEFLASGGWYLLDKYGRIYAGGGAALPARATPYFGFNIARALELQ